MKKLMSQLHNPWLLNVTGETFVENYLKQQGYGNLVEDIQYATNK